jgi:hypothetical protein
MLLLFTFILINLANAQLFFSEIMYDCPGSDAKKEWIEIYNSGEEINLTEFKINEGGANHKLNFYLGNEIILPGEFVVIADNPKTFMAEFLYFNETIFDTSFNSGLSAKGENLILKDINSNILDNITYNASIGAKGNGHTLCLIDNHWEECLPTPGIVNKIIVEIYNNTIGSENEPSNNGNLITEDQKIVLSERLTEDLFSGEKYTSLFKIKINDKNDCSLKDTLQFEYNISGNNYFYENTFSKKIGCSSYASTGVFVPDKEGMFTLCAILINSTLKQDINETVSLCYDVNVIDTSNFECDISLSLDQTENILYNLGESFKFKFNLNNDSYPYNINYWIEDLFGNMFKNKILTTNINKKSWKTKINEKDRVLLLKGEVFPLCKDINLSNNIVEKMFIVKNNQQILGENSEEISAGSSEEGSSINIIKVSPETVSFGKAINVDVEVYKGNTGKYSLGAWLEKDDKIISQKTKINLKKKYSDYKFTLPIQLKPNCNLKVPEGKAKIVIEGLNEREEYSVNLEGVDKTLCKDYLSYVKELEKESSADKKSKLSYEVINFESDLYSGEEIVLPIKFINDDNNHDFKIWSYLYRGSKCYSCCDDCEIVKEKDDNLNDFSLSAKGTKVVELPLIIDDNLDSGKYKLKVKINKDNQKTNKEITLNITIKEKLVSSESEEGSNMLSANDLCTGSSIENEQTTISDDSLNNNFIKKSSKGIIVYESNSEKAKQLIPTILMVTFALLSLILATLIFRKN